MESDFWYYRPESRGGCRSGCCATRSVMETWFLFYRVGDSEPVLVCSTGVDGLAAMQYVKGARAGLRSMSKLLHCEQHLKILSPQQYVEAGGRIEVEFSRTFISGLPPHLRSLFSRLASPPPSSPPVGS